MLGNGFPIKGPQRRWHERQPTAIVRCFLMPMSNIIAIVGREWLTEKDQREMGSGL